MTLRRRLTTHLAVLLFCLAATASVAWWGVVSLDQDYGVALRGYEEQRRLYEVTFHLSTARLLLAIDLPDIDRARLEARKALQLIEPTGGDPTTPRGKLAGDVELRTALLATIDRLAGRRPDAQALDVPLGTLSQRINDVRARIAAVEDAANRKRQRALLLMSVVTGLSALGAVVVSVRGYRAVIHPLTRFSAGVHRVAGGRFDQRIEPAADDAREFASLTEDFNRMAAELEALYRDLHDRVEARTRQLLRSERLAGVGFLAAGVAHEINNPLGIITGYAELWLADPDGASARRTLEVVREEAFRCKAIVERLLALSRGPAGVQEGVRLDLLAAEVAGLLSGLPQQKNRPLDVTPGEAGCVVRADAGEIRQLLLNLYVNALAAIGDAAGRVSVGVSRQNDWVELTVADTGRGMTAETVAHLFEPFYAAAPAGERSGLGLGLSISHAIVQSHGGTIDAESAGPGNGSRFVVRFPAHADDRAL